MKIEGGPKIQTHLALGDAYMEANCYSKALRAYRDGLALSPDEERIVRNIGKALTLSNEYEKAIVYFERFLLKAPDKVDVTLDLASLYMKTHQYPKACQVLTLINSKYLLPWKDHMRLSLKLAQIYLFQGDYDQSKAKLLDSITSKHTKIVKSKDAHAQEVISCLVLDLVEKAPHNKPLEKVKICETVIECIGENENVLFALSKLLLHTTKIDACHAVCEKILMVNPTHEGVIIILGNIYVNRSKFDEALTLYKEFLDDQPYSYIVAFEYLKLLDRMDRVNEFNKIIESFFRHRNHRDKVCIAGRDVCMVRICSTSCKEKEYIYFSFLTIVQSCCGLGTLPPYYWQSPIGAQTFQPGKVCPKVA